MLALFEACDLAELGEADPGRVFLVETWTGPHMSIELDTMLVFSSAADLIAYGEVTARNPARSIDAFTRFHPTCGDERILSEMLSWAERRAGERLAAGTTPLRHGTSAGARSTIDLLRANGYRHVRTFWHMQRSIEGVAPPGEPPEGIRIRPMIVGQDEHGLYEADTEAFRDHFGFEEVPEQELWREWHDFDPHDPTLWFVAEASNGVIVGVCMNFIGEGIGWVGGLGVRPAWRGRGIATALLHTSFAELAARGARVAQLNVDSENETGATRLYEHVGMSVRREFPVFEKQIEAASHR